MKGLLKVAPYAAPAFIVTATIPVVWRFAKSIRQAKPIKNEGLYEDKDGVGFGMAASFALAVNSLVQLMEYHEFPLIWLLFGSWVRDDVLQYSENMLTEHRYWH
jgi:hypothetical protein